MSDDKPPGSANLLSELYGQEPSESYLHDALALDAACVEYFRTHGAQCCAFNWPSSKAYVIAPLRFLLLVAIDKPTRDFIAWLDERTQQRCTVTQLRVLFEARGEVQFLGRPQGKPS